MSRPIPKDSHETSYSKYIFRPCAFVMSSIYRAVAETLKNQRWSESLFYSHNWSIFELTFVYCENQLKVWDTERENSIDTLKLNHETLWKTLNKTMEENIRDYLPTKSAVKKNMQHMNLQNSLFANFNGKRFSCGCSNKNLLRLSWTFFWKKYFRKFFTKYIFQFQRMC